jgi:hypothetical protein
MRAKIPAKMKRAPRALKERINGLIDWAQANEVIVGQGLRESQTVRGRELKLSPETIIPTPPASGFFLLASKDGQLFWTDTFNCETGE